MYARIQQNRTYQLVGILLTVVDFPLIDVYDTND